MPAAVKIFCLSGCLFALASACRSPYDSLRQAPPEVAADCAQRFHTSFSTIIYKTEVSVVGKRLGGLLVFKTMPSGSRRVVFASEAGPTFFDFEFARQDSFRVHYCMKKLDRKAVIRTLRKDLELLLLEGLGQPGGQVKTDGKLLYFPFSDGKETNWLVADAACENLLRVENASRRKKKVTAAFSPPFQEGMPDTVRVEHHNFNFSIFLVKMERGAGGS